MTDEGLRRFLLQHPGVTDEIAQRVYPAPLPQGATLPAVTYTDLSDVGSYTAAGPTCLRRVSYQIDHWADTRETAQRVERATRRLLSGWRGQFPGGLRVGGIFRRNSRTLYEQETQLWRVATDYQINAIGE